MVTSALASEILLHELLVIVFELGNAECMILECSKFVRQLLECNKNLFKYSMFLYRGKLDQNLN